MIRGLLCQSVRFIAAATLFSVATGSFTDSASATRYRAKRYQESPEQAAPVLAARPMLAIVSIRDQRVTFYDAKGNSIRSGVSSGQRGLETPVGIYSVLEKDIDHRSNIYDDAQMPFMQRITWTGIALHAGVLPGYPASHGCVRMAYNFAENVFPLTRVGMRVVIARDDVAPLPISDPLLFKPTPPGQPKLTATSFETGGDTDTAKAFSPDLGNYPAREAEFDELKAIASSKSLAAENAIAQTKELKRTLDKMAYEKSRAEKLFKNYEGVKRAADGRVTGAEKMMLAAKDPAASKKAEAYKARIVAGNKDVYARYDAMKAKLDAATKAWSDANVAFTASDKVREKIVAEAQDAKWKTQPVSVFISLKTKRLYIRQGYEPVLDVPVTIADPEQPIGTHIFTALDYTDAKATDLKWNVVSIGTRKADDDGAGFDRQLMRSNAPAEPTNVAAAKEALARVTIPHEVAERVASAAWPGASLIISDEAANKETGKATDFIVTISSEPQGGMKRTRRQYPKVYREDFWGDSYYDYDGRGRRRYKAPPSFFNWW